MSWRGGDLRPHVSGRSERDMKARSFDPHTIAHILRILANQPTRDHGVKDTVISSFVSDPTAFAFAPSGVSVKMIHCYFVIHL